jgi:hypothetical protein
VYDAFDRYVDRLVGRGARSLLRTAKGTIRFDLPAESEKEHWVLTIAGGAISGHGRRCQGRSIRGDGPPEDARGARP